MKTLTAGQAAQKALSYYKIVFLVEIDADAPDVGISTQYYASRNYTLSAQAYKDLFAPDGLQLSWQRLRVGGGLAAVSGFSLGLRNEAKEFQLVDTYALENDIVRAYAIFPTGSEVTADKIGIALGVIENYPWEVRNWQFDIIDGSDKAFRSIPASLVNLLDYPDAPLDGLGKVVPVAFGALNVGPFDGAGAFPLLAPCRCVDIFTRKYTSGLYNDVYGAPYQYYSEAKRLAEILNYASSGGFFTVNDATRKLLVAPVLPKGTNDVSGWKAVADGNTSAGVAIVNLSNLDVYLGGVPKLGTLTAITMEIKATGGYTYTIKLGATTKAGPSAVSGDQSIALTASDHADTWDFERYNVEIDGTGAATIKEIYLDLRYDDQQTADRQGLEIFQKITGWEDLVARYNDGAVINSSGAPLTNPSHIIEAIFRGQVLLNQPSSEINLTSLDTAATDRNGWVFAFSLNEAVNLDWINEFCFQAGFHLFKDFQGKWKVVAQIKTRTPQHAFFADYHLAVKNPEAPIREWEYDCGFSRTPVRDLINEIVLRYRKDRATGEYTAIKIASGHYRVTGTCTTSTATGKLTSSGSTFVTDGVLVGDTAYVSGDQNYTVTAVDSQTVLSITPTGGGSVTDNTSSKTFWLGPNLDGRMIRSQQRYKTEAPLGDGGEGGYVSDLIVDSTTATNLVEHLIEWRSQRRLTVEFATFMNAIDVEIGDACFFDHSWLPVSKRPISTTTLNGAINSSTASVTVATGEAGKLRVNDYIQIDYEVMLITAVDTGTNVLTVTRAQCNTVAASHSNGAAVKLLNRVKWEVSGLQPVPNKAQIRLEIQEMPPSYNPIGRVVAAGYPNYDAATVTQRTQSGWATKPSGRMVEEDEYSNISYVGA